MSLRLTPQVTGIMLKATLFSAFLGSHYLIASNADLILQPLKITLSLIIHSETPTEVNGGGRGKVPVYFKSEKPV